MPFYLELVMMQPVARVGLLIAVVPLVLAILGPLSGSLSDRFGTRPVSIVGLILLVIGYLTASTVTATIAIPLGYILRMLPIGLGMGVFQSPNNSAIMGAAPRTRLGIASSMLSLTRTLGQTAGIAVMGAFFASRLNYYAGQPVEHQCCAGWRNRGGAARPILSDGRSRQFWTHPCAVGVAA